MGKPLGHAALLAVLAVSAAWAADETSSGDKLRIIYSNRFTFDDRGIPLVTVEIMGGQDRLVLSSKSGMQVLPDGDGGSAIHAGKRWVVTLEGGRPAQIREWTIVARLDPERDRAITAALRKWRALGYRPRAFETGSIFGVEGEVVDSREVLIGVAPVGEGKGARKAAAISRKHNVVATVHTELVERPGGTVVARSGDVVIKNSSVIWFAPSRDDGTVTVADVVNGHGGSQPGTSRETRRYFGSVYAAVGRDGKLVAVNAIAADQLLAGLVPSETFADAPMEALKAQAVAARTELLERIGTRHFGDPFLLCSNQHCQVYSGAGKEHPRTTAAVTKTRGQVLMGEGGELVDARYSASCGGHSEHNDNIWGGHADPNLRGKVDAPAKSATSRFEVVDASNLGSFLDKATDAHCARTKYSKGRYRWSVDVGVDELTRRVSKRYPQVGTLRSLRPLERGVSGRIRRLELRGSRGTAVAEGDLHIRRLLGGLRSTLFEVRRVGDRFVFKGAGFGHGVGMCQVGAIGMAQKRNSFRDILYHYYSGSRLKRLY